ncbi:MAG: hypothetical protein K8R85_01535 [Bacteroidetes bacterium]|nr:hypothetical protein [Bacteroidota bacterium]
MAASRILNQATNPYSAGALVLDTTPITQYYLNQQAKKEAKDEALDKYYQDQMASLSSKGLREIDMSRFSDKFNKLKQLFIQNKEAIKNPMKYGFEKSQEFNELKQELTNYPELSKQAKDEKAQALKISMNPANRDLIDIPSFDESLKFHDLPIGDPNRKALNLSNLPYLAKQLNPSEYNTYIKGVLSNVGTTGSFGESKKVGNFMVETPYTKEYSKENLLKAGERTKIDAVSNPSLKRTAKIMFDNAPDTEKANLAKIHQDYFGKPLLNGEDILAAQVIQSGLTAKEVETKQAPNFGLRAATNNAYISGRKTSGKASGEETYDFIKKGSEILQSGNADLANQYFSTWKAASKNEIGGNIGFQNVSYTPAGWIKIKYNAPITQEGVTVAVPTEVKLDPKDPQLLNKITGLHQQFMGGDVKVEKAAQKEAAKAGAAKSKEIKETKTFVFPKGKTKF